MDLFFIAMEAVLILIHVYADQLYVLSDPADNKLMMFLLFFPL